MIYIKTKFGWYNTGCTEQGQLKIHWIGIAQAFWDSNLEDFVWPGTISHYRTMGMAPIDPKTKLQMWTMGDDFPLFDETEYFSKINMNKIKDRYRTRSIK